MTAAPATQELASAAGLGGGFTGIDWAIVFGTLVAITIIGHKLTGRIATVRDFYLGGRRLPWYAVSASLIATEISAVTFFAVPSLVWGESGSIAYLQIGLFSALVARLVIASVLAPAYYEREVYSPYDFMGHRLGRSVRRMTSVLFMIGGTLAQAARVYITAVVIEVLAYEELRAVADVVHIDPLALAIIGIALVALLWTGIGGVATVVWTDAMLFLLFIGGIGAILVTLHGQIAGGLGAAIDLAHEKGRLRLFGDGSASDGLAEVLTSPYGLVSVFVGASWALIAPYGTDQLMAQRILCCRSKGAAQLAVLGGYFAVFVVAASFLVGVGLLGYYDQNAMGAGAAALVDSEPTRLLPVYVREVLPVGVRGLVLAAAFAAAISSLDSILAALSQTTEALRRRWLTGADDAAAADYEDDDRSDLGRSRTVVVLWAVVLAVVAIYMENVEERYDDLLELALGMSGIVGGPLLAGFFLAWISKDADHARGASGFLWAAPLGVLTVAFAAFAGPTAHDVSWYPIGALFLAWLTLGLPRRRQPYGAVQTLLYGFVLFLLTRVAAHGDLEVMVSGEIVDRSLAWVWYVPAGSLVTVVFSLLLDGSRHHAQYGE